MKYCWFILFMLAWHSLGAQNLDSLNTIWNDSDKKDSIRLDAFDQIIWTLNFQKPDSAQTLCREMRDFATDKSLSSWLGRTYFLEAVSVYVRGDLENAQTLLKAATNYYDSTKDFAWLARAHNVWGMSFRKMGEQDQALKHYAQARAFSHKLGDNDTEATILSNISTIQMEQGKISSAMETNMDILNIYQDKPQAQNLARAYDNIAQLFYQQDNFESSMAYRSKSLEIVKAIDARIDIGIAYNEMSSIHFKLGDKAMSRLYLDSAMTVGNSLNNLEILSRAYVNKGSYARDAGQLDLALEAYAAGLEAFERLGFILGQAKAVVAMAEIYLAIDELKKSEELAKQGYELAHKSGNPEIIAPACKILHEIYDRYGQHKAAYDMYSEYVLMRDSVTNRENDRNLVRQEEKYLYEKQKLLAQQEAAEKEAMLRQESLLAKNELLAQEAERKKLIYGIIGLALLAGLFILLLLIMRLRKKRDELKKEKLMQLKLSEQLVYWQEEERKRVAHDLHDGLGQRLSIIKNTLQGGAWSQEDVVASVGQAIQEVRNVSEALRPRQLDILGLKAAIEELVDDTFSGTTIDHTSHINDIDSLLSKDEEVSIYRIIQEATNNVLKYADCSKVQVSIAHNPGQSMYIKIEDNGKGFTQQDISESKEGGFGLRGMQERVNFLQGKFDVTSMIGEGTLIQIVIPVSERRKRA